VLMVDTFDAFYIICERVVCRVPMLTRTKGPNTFYAHDVILHLTASQCLIKHKMCGPCSIWGHYIEELRRYLETK
jgi:hypothetical protein